MSVPLKPRHVSSFPHLDPALKHGRRISFERRVSFLSLAAGFPAGFCANAAPKVRRRAARSRSRSFITKGRAQSNHPPPGCNTGDVFFLSGLLANEGTGGHVRYAIDARGAVAAITLIGVANAQPIYDPGRVGQSFGGANLRQPANFLGFNLQYASIAGPRAAETIRTLLPSPPGRDLVLALRDSTDNTAGAYGNLEVRKNDSNKTAILQLRGDIHRFATRGPIIANGLVGPITLTANSATPDAGFTSKPSSSETGDPVTRTPAGSNGTATSAPDCVP